MACEREDCAFMLVEATVRDSAPVLKHSLVYRGTQTLVMDHILKLTGTQTPAEGKYASRQGCISQDKDDRATVHVYMVLELPCNIQYMCTCHEIIRHAWPASGLSYCMHSLHTNHTTFLTSAADCTRCDVAPAT